MEKVYQYGWESYCSSLESKPQDISNVGRVAAIKGFRYEVVTNQGVHQAELLGKLQAIESEHQPKVGDWVNFILYDDTAFINEVLPRKNQLYRKAVGKASAKQVLATNLDNAIIIQGMDNDFNLNRLERYVVQIIGCGIKPIIILNKSDLVPNPDVFVEEVRKLGRETQVFVCSVKTGDGIPEILDQVFIPGSTSVLIGSSGVGKSSLTNLLFDENVASTAEISSATQKGKHTTTTREMFVLKNGGIIIDTPGMREFGLGFDEDVDLSEQFPVIDQYAGECRFNDCSHTSEDGCKVIEALENCDIDPVVYENYHKLVKEQRRFQLSQHEKRRQGKQFEKMARDAQAIKKRYKGK